MIRTVRINRDRLGASLMELKEIGAYVDELAAHPQRRGGLGADG